MRKRDMGELFEVFSDPRPSGAGALRSKKNSGSGFRKFLEDRGEYPFKDDEAGTGKFQMRRMFQLKTETLLVLALAFLIANIASFSVGVWNGKRGSADAAEPTTLAAPDTAVKLGDVTGPKVVTEQVPRPIRPRPGRSPVATPIRREVPVPPPLPMEGKYTIRVASLGLSQTKEARGIADFFSRQGYNPAKVRRVGKNLVIEVGAFTSTKDPKAVRALRDIRGARYNYTRFKDAFFVRKN